MAVAQYLRKLVRNQKLNSSGSQAKEGPGVDRIRTIHSSESLVVGIVILMYVELSGFENVMV